jgi:6-bladed beta-propeller protein
MKKMILVLVLVLMSTAAFAEHAITLPEIMDPAMIEVNNVKLYVLQRTEIFIYSIKDKKLIKKFGREGEGPGEFIINPYGAPMSLTIQGEQLVINSTNKISYFSLDGKYLNETPAPPNTVFVPMKGEYLGIGAALPPGKQQPQLAFRIFDKDFRPHTALYYTDIIVGNLRNISLPMEALHYIPYYKD